MNHGELTFDELQRLKWGLGGGLALLSLSTVLHIEIDVGAWLALATAGVLLTLALPALPARLPRWINLATIPPLIAVFAWDLFHSTEILPPFVRLNLLLVMLRCLAPRSRREDMQLVALCLFLLIISGVMTVSVSFVLQILAFTAWGLAFLFTVNLVHAAGETETPGGAWTRIGWWTLARRLHEAVDWRLPLFGSALFLLTVLLSAVLFLSIPRFELQNALPFMNLASRRTLSGFSEHVAFGEVTELQQDNSVALRVETKDVESTPASPYWRMVALDEYRDGAFRVSPVILAELNQRRMYAWLLAGLRTGPSPPLPKGEWTVYMEPGISRYLPVPGLFGAIRLRERQPVQTSLYSHLVALRGDPLTLSAFRIERLDCSGDIPDTTVLSRFAEARARTTAREGAAPSGEKQRVVHPLTLLDTPDGPGDRATLQRLTAEITRGGQLTAREFAARASAWLAQRHGYSLSSGLPPGTRDPLVRWLDSREPGHCELFAGGFILLARTAGFPARMVTGFLGGDWNGYEGYFMVRNSDAHAWCELHDGVRGWFRVDPTPGAGPAGGSGAAAARLAVDSSWTAWADSIRMIWYRRIVSFDQQSQVELVQSLREASEHSGDALADAWRKLAAAVRDWLSRPFDAVRLAWIAAVAGAVSGVLLLLREVRRRLRQWLFSRGGAASAAVRRRAGAWLLRLRRVGTPAAADACADLERIRYGRIEQWPDPDAVFARSRSAWRRRRRRTEGLRAGG